MLQVTDEKENNLLESRVLLFQIKLMNNTPVRIILADDHPIVRQGLRALLTAEPDFRLIGETGDGLEAVKLVGPTK